MKKIVSLFIAVFLMSLPLNEVFAASFKGVKYKEGSGGSGSITGTVIATSTPPKMTEIVKEKNPEVCGTGIRVIDPYTIGGSGELKEAVVYIQDITSGKKWPTNDFKFDQKGCAFLPFISVMRNKKKVEVQNLDPVGHNIHTYEMVGDLFKGKPIKMTVLNIGQPDQGFTFKKKIKLRRDNQMKMECDIHNFMHGWMLVLENPYYQIVSEDGKYKLDGVPDGKYKVVAWHPSFGRTVQTVTVSGGEATANFEL